jgi:hypothetical protein
MNRTQKDRGAGSYTPSFTINVRNLEELRNFKSKSANV